MQMNLSTIRQRLVRLAWKDGLTREGIRLQWEDIPADLFELLPGGYRFQGPGDVMSYVEHLRRDEPILLGPMADPHGYEDSSMVRSFDLAPHQHGVGSGADSGNTGAGSTQTGVSREGTTYGEPEEEERGPETG